jgi:xylulokinase
MYAHVMPGLWCADAGMNATGTLLLWAAEVLAGGEVGDLERLAAAAAPGCDGLLCSPYLAEGERTSAAARGAWAGLSLRHGRPHLARSVYEGLTFGLRAALDGLRAAGIAITQVRASGGATRGRLWNQLKADAFGVPVTVAAHHEAAALGAAMLAGAAAGVFASLGEAVERCARLGETLEPRREHTALYEETYRRWRRLFQESQADSYA